MVPAAATVASSDMPTAKTVMIALCTVSPSEVTQNDGAVGFAAFYANYQVVRTDRGQDSS